MSEIVRKVLVTDGVHPILLEKLKASGFEIDYQPAITLSAVHDCIASYEGLIINSKIIVDESLLKKAKLLNWVGRLGSGVEIIDFDAAKKYGVTVESSPEGNRNAVAEHMLGMLLSLLNHLGRLDREVKALHWDREAARGYELSGKTVGLIGFGHTGKAFATKLQGMGVRILAYDKYHPHFKDHFPQVEPAELAEIQQMADIISIHLPLTDETRNLINRDFIDQCKDGFYLLNSARGSCVNTKDLLEALERGKCRGACLDVFENEKPATFTEEESLFLNRLYTHPNVQLSPHVAGWTFESKLKLATILFAKLSKSF